MKRVLGAALVAATLAPAIANAWDAPGQRPAIDGRMVAEIGVAVEFWAARGVQGCPNGIAAYYADDLSGTDTDHANGRGASCTIWVAADFAAAHRADNLQGHASEDASEECALIAHEVGHALGLAHTTEGVMAPQANVPPWDCRAWAKKAFPVKRQKRPKRYTWVR